MRGLTFAFALATLGVFALAKTAAAQELVSFSTQDGGLVYADAYGQGERGVVLAPAAR